MFRHSIRLTRKRSNESLASSKFFGGKSPGIDNAWQLADLVFRAIASEHSEGITEAVQELVGGKGRGRAEELRARQREELQSNPYVRGHAFLKKLYD